MIFWWLRGPLLFFYILVDVFCSDRLANHQKLNVIQKWTFYFSMIKGAFFVFLHFGRRFLLWSLGQSSEVEHNPKMNILFFNDLGGLFVFLRFGRCFLLRLLGWSSEVEHNPEMNIWFFDDLGAFLFFSILINIFCSDCLADHQKLNVIQKWTFYFSMT